MAAFLFVSIIPLLISGYQLSKRTEEELKSSLNENNYLVSRTISEKLDAFEVEKWISTLDGLASSPAWNIESDPNQNVAMINSYFSQIRELVILSVRTRVHSEPKHYINQFFLNEWKGWNPDSLAALFLFNADSAAGDKRVFIRDPVFIHGSNIPFLPIEIIQHSSVDWRRSLRGVFQMPPIFEFINEEMSPMQRQIYVLDSRGRILFQNKYGQFDVGRILPYPMNRPIRQTSSVFQTLQFSHLGKKYLGYRLPNPRTGWVVMVVYLYDSAYAMVSQMKRQMVMNIGFALILCIAMSSLFAWFHSSVIYHAKEILRKYAEKLEQSNAELEAFAYSISHQLSAPLRHIVNYSDVLEMRLSSTLDKKSRHQLQNISDAAKNLSELIYHVLTFSRVGYADINKTRIDLAKMVLSIRSKLETDIASRKISWKTDTGAPLWGDPVMLQQVMLNLISNALKFTRHRKRAMLKIGSRLETDEVIVYVSDNGVGFDMKDKNRLFGLFQRLHDREAFEGSGVGLAHVRRIISRHGGQTWAVGEPGKGATFYFSLPVQLTPDAGRRHRSTKWHVELR